MSLLGASPSSGYHSNPVRSTSLRSGPTSLFYCPPLCTTTHNATLPKELPAVPLWEISPCLKYIRTLDRDATPLPVPTDHTLFNPAYPMFYIFQMNGERGKETYPLNMQDQLCSFHQSYNHLLRVSFAVYLKVSNPSESSGGVSSSEKTDINLGDVLGRRAELCSPWSQPHS